MRLRLVDRMGEAETRWLRQVSALAAELGLAAWLVGGAVRDALLGCGSLDLDVTVVGEAAPLAQALAAATGGRLIAHARFGTHVIEVGEFHFDIATARRETYAHPGALPEVQPASLDEDLARRDFTINALALRLDEQLDTLYDPLDGRGDLQRRLVRGLHPATFMDDPTRIIRAARYAARLGYEVERDTQAWLEAAVAANALGLVTGPRLWGELSRLLAEPAAPQAVSLLARWGALSALGLGLPEHTDLRELFAVTDELGPLTDQDRALAGLALLAGDHAEAVGDHFCLSAHQRQAVLVAADLTRVPPPAVVSTEASNSALYETLVDVAAAGRLALWAAHPAARPALLRFAALAELKPEINGQDLQQLGHAPSPGFKVALAAALRARLDKNATRKEQLAAALEALTAWQRGGEP